MRSTEEVLKVRGSKYVGDVSLRRQRLVFVKKSSTILPLISLSLFCSQSGLWALKSPNKMNGVGNWLCKFRSCSNFIGTPGGKYIEHIVKGRYVEILIAVAWKLCIKF